MALSKEFYLDEIRSKYPNSYNESLKDLPVKDLEDMLDFLEGALGKADGGSIGIEVLFGPKRDEYQTGGRIGFNMGGAQFTSGGNISPGTDKRGNVRDDNPFTGGGGGDGPPSIINPPPTKDKSTELFTFDEYTGKPMTYADVVTANKFLNLVKTKGSYTMGEDPEADALYDAYKTATGRDTFMQDATVDSVTNMRTTDVDGNTESFIDRTSTITDNPTGKMTKSLMVETPTSFTQRFITPTGIMENDVPQKFGAPQSLSVDPYSNNIIGSDLRADLTKSQKKALGKQKMGYEMGLFSIDDVRENIKPLGDPDNPATNEEIKEFFQAKDGGRVGFFMGGPALEGQALQIYNSMNAYGFTDQEIADALSARGLYTPAGSGSTQPEQVTGIINQQINQGRDTGPTRPTSEIVADFQETITNRQNKLNNPGKIASFVGDFIPQQRSIADMLASGQVDTRLTGGIPLGIGSMIAKALPDKYYDMSLADQITTQAYMGYTDPNTNMANKDPFGLNVRSAFGNYAEKAAEIVGTLEEKLARKGTLSKYDQLRLDHYRNVTKTKQDAVADIGLINLAKQQAEEKRQRDIQEAATRRTYSLSDLQDSSDRGTGQSYAAARARTASRVGPGGNVKAYGLKDGGLATMFTRRR